MRMRGLIPVFWMVPSAGRIKPFQSRVCADRAISDDESAKRGAGSVDGVVYKGGWP